ncbi:LAMI_0D07844g1_1 [Lachancea mirantina]|uniref:LAMI_0D07844g1_1 n=1 Tax=Lachancea mirantina TaxID=1230905 RepID=A0A1G4JCX1_9SACH|nr:LAMI_0D07844g1_1 [Lachancea mirantina]
MLVNKFLRLDPRAVRHYQILSGSRKVLPVYPPAEKKSSSNLLSRLSALDQNALDPQGWRRKLISGQPDETTRAGDVVRVVYDSNKCNYDNFVGYVLAVDRKSMTQDASLLLRNQVAKTFVEVRVPIFSPIIQRIDILRKSDGRRKRNKHYYIRGTKLDVGDLEAGLRKRK